MCAPLNAIRSRRATERALGRAPQASSELWILKLLCEYQPPEMARVHAIWNTMPLLAIAGQVARFDWPLERRPLDAAVAAVQKSNHNCNRQADRPANGGLWVTAQSEAVRKSLNIENNYYNYSLWFLLEIQELFENINRQRAADSSTATAVWLTPQYDD